MQTKTQQQHQQDQAQPPPQLIRLPEVEKLTGIKRTQIYRLQQAGSFPRRIKLGARCSAYVASEVHAWIAARIADSRGVAQ